MACGMEALIIAVRLATELVRSEPDPNIGNLTVMIPAVCGCECASTQADALRCRASVLDDDAKRVAKYNAKVAEFNQITDMCQVIRGAGH